MSEIQLTTHYKRYSCHSGRKYTRTHSLRGFTTYAKQFLIQNIQIHVQYKIVIRVINIIIRNVYLMDGNHIFW